MKQLLITIAAVVLVGCGESQSPDMRLIQSIKFGDTNSIKNAIRNGADVNANMGLDWDERRPLHVAATLKLKEHKEVAALLIAEGADVNGKDNRGYTILHFAAMFSTKEMVEMLIEKGADVNANGGRGIGTPLHCAIKAKKSEIADLLRKHGGKTKPDISIHKAVQNGNIEAVKQHLSAGTNVDEKNYNDMTPLHRALERGHREIVKLLIAKGADVNAKDSYGMTPLHYAARWGYKEIAELLIEKGVDVNPKDEIGFTPLDVAEVGREDDSPEDKAVKKEIYDLLRKHGGKTGEELDAAGN